MAISFTMTIESGDDAFGIAADASHELARILRKLANRLADTDSADLTLRDINGNACGRCSLSITSDEDEE